MSSQFDEDSHVGPCRLPSWSERRGYQWPLCSHTIEIMRWNNARRLVRGDPLQRSHGGCYHMNYDSVRGWWVNTFNPQLRFSSCVCSFPWCLAVPSCGSGWHRVSSCRLEPPPLLVIGLRSLRDGDQIVLRRSWKPTEEHNQSLRIYYPWGFLIFEVFSVANVGCLPMDESPCTS